jgi:hypothetical protein
MNAGGENTRIGGIIASKTKYAAKFRRPCAPPAYDIDIPDAQSRSLHG